MFIEELAICVVPLIAIPRVICGLTDSVAAIMENFANVTIKMALSELSFKNALVAITGEAAHTMRLAFFVQGSDINTGTILSNTGLHIFGDIQSGIILVEHIFSRKPLDVVAIQLLQLVPSRHGS